VFFGFKKFCDGRSELAIDGTLKFPSFLKNMSLPACIHIKRELIPSLLKQVSDAKIFF
jgi:hypothetical protein